MYLVPARMGCKYTQYFWPIKTEIIIYKIITQFLWLIKWIPYMKNKNFTIRLHIEAMYIIELRKFVSMNWQGKHDQSWL